MSNNKLENVPIDIIDDYADFKHHSRLKTRRIKGFDVRWQPLHVRNKVYYDWTTTQSISMEGVPLINGEFIQYMSDGKYMSVMDQNRVRDLTTAEKKRLMLVHPTYYTRVKNIANVFRKNPYID
jgi:hypothetical protein